MNLSPPSGEFWLGLENVHSLSKQGRYLLQVEISDWSGQRQMARYQFQLDGEERRYALHLEQVPSSGDLGETVTTGASGLPFSTSDRDNDLNADVNCAELLSGTCSCQVLTTLSIVSNCTKANHIIMNFRVILILLNI